MGRGRKTPIEIGISTRHIAELATSATSMGIYTVESLKGGIYYFLEDDDYRLALVDNIADGEGYTFAILVGDDDNELARLAAERYPRGVDFHPVNLVAVEQPLADNLVHGIKIFAKIQIIYGMAK